MSTLVVTLSLLLSACGGAGTAGTEAAGELGTPQRGGELTVLLDAAFSGTWPAGLDPATNTNGGANISQMNAIFGTLFRVTADENGENSRAEPVLAEGWERSADGRTVTITLREGVEFSDGTPFDAEAVVAHFNRAVSAPCTCSPDWKLAEPEPFVAEDERTITVNLSEPQAAFINLLVASNANWVPSPTALAEMGEEQFKQKPVGAGPFTVASNQMSNKLVLERNENYWDGNKPYLDRLTFQAIGGDQAGYQALLAGQAQVYEAMSTPPLIRQARDNPQLQVTQQPPTAPFVLQLNTTVPPFDDQRAREAIYYATNVEAINQGLFDGKAAITQMFTAPGGLFHHAEVPGYRNFDLPKAKALVQELDGLTVKLGATDDLVGEQILTALKTQWEKAGITVSFETYQLSALIQEFLSDKWQAMMQSGGSWDPHGGVGFRVRFRSDSQLTGVHDQHLDDLMLAAGSELDPEKRSERYLEAATYLSDKAYAPFLLAYGPTNVAAEGVHGPGLTTKIPPVLLNTGIHWDSVWTSTR